MILILYNDKIKPITDAAYKINIGIQINFH